MLADAWAETAKQGTKYKKKWCDPIMKDKAHPKFDRKYVAFEDVPARVPSILDEVREFRTLVINLLAFDLARGKNVSYA